MPQPQIAKLLGERFVGLASDCDAPETEVVDLARAHMADAMMLPFVMFTDSDGRYLGGSHGHVDPKGFQAALTELTS